MDKRKGFQPGHPFYPARRRSLSLMAEDFGKEEAREAVANGLRQALAHARAHEAILWRRQTDARVSKAEKARAAREARFWTAQIVSLAEQLKPFVPTSEPASPADPRARVQAEIERLNRE